jgi:hypothetical protein
MRKWIREGIEAICHAADVGPSDPDLRTDCP